MTQEIPILHQNLLPLNNEAGKGAPINDDILNSTLNCLERETMDSIAQPHLIVGTDGSGKTHILRQIESRIQKDDGGRFQTVFIEGRTLFSTDDLWSRTAELLQINGASATYADISEWQKERSRRIVLLIDNIQYYLERTDNADHFALRGKLNKPAAPIIIATSDKMLPAFTNYDAAFFDAFKTSYIRPLSAQETKVLINGAADTERVGKLMNYLPKTPRSLLISMNIIKKSSAPEMDLVYLTDFFSDLYKNKYNEQPAQVQKILSILSHTDEGAELRDIREKSKQDNGKLSPYLKIMVDRKLADKTARTPRCSVYRISDPLFGLWLKMNGLTAE